MQKLKLFVAALPVIVLCLIGMTAALLRLRRLDDWCAAQLDD